MPRPCLLHVFCNIGMTRTVQHIMADKSKYICQCLFIPGFLTVFFAFSKKRGCDLFMHRHSLLTDRIFMEQMIIKKNIRSMLADPVSIHMLFHDFF